MQFLHSFKTYSPSPRIEKSISRPAAHFWLRRAPRMGSLVNLHRNSSLVSDESHTGQRSRTEKCWFMGRLTVHGEC